MASGGVQKMAQLVNWLMTQKDVEAFLEPVEWKALGLEDYPLIIKHPMDLGTIKSRLESGHYTRHSQVADDIRLVWINCKTYNQETSYLYKVADRLSQKFEERYLKIRQEEPETPGDESQAPSLEDKRQFRANMYKVGSDELGELLKVLEERSPGALDKVSNKDEIEINIDKITPRVFYMLADMLKKKATEKTKSKKKKAAPAGGDDGTMKKG